MDRPSDEVDEPTMVVSFLMEMDASIDAFARDLAGRHSRDVTAEDYLAAAEFVFGRVEASIQDGTLPAFLSEPVREARHALLMGNSPS